MATNAENKTAIDFINNVVSPSDSNMARPRRAAHPTSLATRPSEIGGSRDAPTSKIGRPPIAISSPVRFPPNIVAMIHTKERLPGSSQTTSLWKLWKMTRSQQAARDIALLALAFQLFHLIEHAAQLTYWSGNPTEAPWLTPWAITGRDVLAVDGTPGGGNEILHLGGI